MKSSKNSKEILIKLIFLEWYKKNKRNLPWRKLEKNNLPNPYYVFISEFMLQQTTVGTVKNRFKEFVLIWPNINTLSRISEKTILSFWSGLGYYSRATNLLKASKIISKKYRNKIPSNYDDLINLPGIGEYTAKAILGIAFNKPVMPIDANIERIIARIYGFKSPISKVKNELKDKSELFKSNKFSSTLIQAFMDYGSLVCTPRNPNCKICVIKKHCFSFKNNLQDIIPIKIKSKLNKRKKYTRAYVFYNENDEILVRKRSSKGMLASMLEVPNDKWENERKNLVYDKLIFKLKNKMQLKGIINYSFSHFELETEVFRLKVNKNSFMSHKWIKKKSLNKSSLPTIMKKIVQTAL